MQKVLEDQKRQSEEASGLKQVIQSTVDAQKHAISTTQNFVARAFVDRSMHPNLNESTENAAGQLNNSMMSADQPQH